MPNWKKLILSGSNASLNSLIVTSGVTGSLFGTSSWSQNTVTASYVNPLTQTVTITGSLLVSGSTTQTGNNTLLGNTTLSGSIVISGSTSPGAATASVQIYGDIRQSGYHRFDPVTTNINTTISASYIYVSGSTNDLYFSQNGSGYSNTTRLRWLEGNLYTGLLNGGLITTQSATVYQIGSGSGIIVNLNASYNNNPYPTVQYLNWSNISASIAPLSASYDQSFVAVQSNGTITAQSDPYTDGQFNTLIPIGVVLHQNRSTINGTQTFASLAYGWKQRSSDFIRAFGPLKLSGLTLSVSGSSTGSLVVSNGTVWSDGRNYTVDPNNPSYISDAGTTISKIFRYRQSGSNWVYDTNSGAGYTTIDPAYYSNNGVLTVVPTNNWSIQRVYWFPNSVTKAFYVYYGNASYTTELDAIANVNIEPFTEAPNTAAQAVYLGALILRYNANFTTPASYKIIPGGLFRNVGGSGGGGGSVTQTLSGLSDVAISSPINGQPLVYNTSLSKWQNASVLTASLSGNATSATTASYINTLTQNVFIVGDLQVTGSISNTLFNYVSSGLVVGDELGGYVQSGNHKVQIVATSTQTPLMIEGGSGAVEIWKDATPTKAASFGMATPGNSVTDDFIFSKWDGASWSETLRISNSDSAINTSGQINVPSAQIGKGLYGTTESNTVSTNSTIFTISTVGTYTCGFIDYHITDGVANARSGQIQIAYVAGQVTHNETATQDIGNTSNFQWDVQMSGSDINLEAIITSGTWDIKLITRII